MLARFCVAKDGALKESMLCSLDFLIEVVENKLLTGRLALPKFIARPLGLLRGITIFSSDSLLRFNSMCLYLFAFIAEDY